MIRNNVILTAALLATVTHSLLARQSPAPGTVIGSGTLSGPFLEHPGGAVRKAGGGVLLQWIYRSATGTPPMVFYEGTNPIRDQSREIWNFYGKDGKGAFYFLGGKSYARVTVSGDKATATAIDKLPDGLLQLDGSPKAKDEPPQPASKPVTFHGWPPEFDKGMNLPVGDHGATVMLEAGGKVVLIHHKSDPADLWMEQNDTSRAFYLSPDRKTGTLLIRQSNGGWKSEDNRTLVISGDTAVLK